MLALIRRYYAARKLKEPTAKEALLWAQTEMGEAIDLRMQLDGGWVRNHEKEPYSPERYAEELGDAIMMLLKAGMAEGVDPLAALEEKLNRKIKEVQSVYIQHR